VEHRAHDPDLDGHEREQRDSPPGPCGVKSGRAVAEPPSTGPAQPPGFSDLIHAPTRLSLMSLLSASKWIEFGLLRDTMELTDSALSKQLATLEDAGLVVLARDGVGRGKRVRVRLSPEGRRAFDVHVAALQAIIARSADPAREPL
jgi:DNA-binding transcriptional ArsR family regulator